MCKFNFKVFSPAVFSVFIYFLIRIILTLLTVQSLTVVHYLWMVSTFVWEEAWAKGGNGGLGRVVTFTKLGTSHELVLNPHIKKH